MTDWSLSQILETLNDTIQWRLYGARRGLSHPGTNGDASENVWIDLFQTYLPKRYQAAKAHVVDSNGNFSEQIDVVIFDRQYSPFIFSYEGQKIIPAESVYAVFEVKQSINACHVRYAQDKVASVRCLHRTSLPIPHAGGDYEAKDLVLVHIYGGLLTFESGWNPALGDSLLKALDTEQGEDKHLDLGCVASHGYFSFEKDKGYKIHEEKPTTAFLFKLISQLQFSGTVPMIDIQAYAKWLTNSIPILEIDRDETN